jgi:hypothetical protein
MTNIHGKKTLLLNGEKIEVNFFNDVLGYTNLGAANGWKTRPAVLSDVTDLKEISLSMHESLYISQSKKLAFWVDSSG